MSIDEENKLGKEFLASVNRELPTIDDSFVNEYLTDLGNYIGQYQDTKPFALNFYIAKDNQLNAFAGPAGHIFIYSGLINAMDKVDELASVISHEIGHVSVRHLSSQAGKEQTRKHWNFGRRPGRGLDRRRGCRCPYCRLHGGRHPDNAQLQQGR